MMRSDQYGPITYVALENPFMAQTAAIEADRHINAYATLRIKCGAPHLMREIRMPGSVRVKPNGIATRPIPPMAVAWLKFWLVYFARLRYKNEGAECFGTDRMEQEMADITLTATSRNSLLSLTNTASLMSRTTGRLTSGLKVASAIDDAVSYFKSKGLTDRAADFAGRKDEIDQGISGIKAAVNGTTLVDSVLKQMKGIVNSVRTADSTTRTALTSQFNDLAKQINSSVTDSSYQGLNLVDNSLASLTVYFNQGTTASLKVHANNMKASAIITSATFAVSGTTSTGTAISDKLLQHGVSTARASTGSNVSTQGFAALSNCKSQAKILDGVLAALDKGVSKIRSQSALLSGNVTFLQSRMDFTSNYISTLQEGSGKLTLADLNEEGANLVSLQTRQQIGIQSLSIAGQQQQAILSLLR